MTSKETISLIFSVLLLFLLGVMGLQDGLTGFFYDDGLYLLGAKSFAEGTGYILSNIGGNAPIIKYPPLFSLVLAPLWFFFPDYPGNLPLLKGFNLLLSTLFLGGFYCYLRHFKQFSKFVTVVICLLFASHFTFYFYSAEILYLCISLFCFMAIEKRDASNLKSKKWIFLTLTGFILLFYARTIGISLLLGQIMTHVVNKKHEKQLVYSLVCGLALLPWMVWSQFQQQTNPLFQLYPLKDGLLYPNFINYMTAFQIQMGQYESFQSMFLINMNQFLIELGSWFIPTPVPLLGIQSVESIWGIGLLLFLLVVLSIAIKINKHPTNPMPYYVGIYLFILFIWGDPVQHPRFLLVIAPFILILLYEGLDSFSNIKFDSNKLIPKGLSLITIFFILLNLQFFGEQEEFKNTPQSLSQRQALHQDFKDAFKNIQRLTQPHQSLYGYYQTAWLLGVKNPVYSLRSIPAPSKVANPIETQIALKQKGIDLAQPDFVLISPFLQDDGQLSFDTLMIACLEKPYSPYKLIYSSPHQLIRLYKSTRLKHPQKEKQHDF